MIIIKSKRCDIHNLRRQYPDAIIHDVTSHATDEFVKFSPFYPHGGIPVPFTPNMTAMSVESIWQGLKDYVNSGIDTSVFRNSTMKDIKRTKRKYGEMRGHKKGVFGTEHLGYLEARYEIYAPTYLWMLEHKVSNLVRKLKEESENNVVILLDYNTNEDLSDRSSPLSHAGLIKAFIEGRYPVSTNETVDPTPVETPEEYEFKLGDKVRHQKFGDGVVKELQEKEGRVVVDFVEDGIKTLAIRLARLEKIDD